jgi:indole-3-glycerol phosphate synthase
MISVLCDGRFFDGGWAHVVEARRALEAANLAVPILAKEFILDSRQLEEAAACGADAALIIVRIHGGAPSSIRALVTRATSLGLEPVLEVVTEAELQAALDAGSRVIGVNARDLDTLAMDGQRATRLLARIPDSHIAVHLSGVKAPEDVAMIARTDADAVLIGESLMRLDDPSHMLAKMMAAAGALPMD